MKILVGLCLLLMSSLAFGQYRVTTFRIYGSNGEYCGREVLSGNSIYRYGPTGMFEGKIDWQVESQSPRFTSSFPGYQSGVISRYYGPTGQFQGRLQRDGVSLYRYDGTGRFSGTVQPQFAPTHGRFAPAFPQSNFRR